MPMEAELRKGRPCQAHSLRVDELKAKGKRAGDRVELHSPAAVAGERLNLQS